MVVGGESVEDAIAGCTSVAMRRCARFGRAPAVYDVSFGFTLWGFIGGAPDDLVEARGPLFRSAAHHYQSQRAIADSVNEEALRLTPEAVAERLGQWRTMITLPDPG
jgi:alkanesulfonate monooxygenase SsuD/methylene tetrahydromethanopterin reductase-like flavin-dependent oxidoreductase (luciferase family)